MQHTIAVWSFWAIIILSLMGLGIILSKDGQPKTGKYNFWSSVVLNGWIIWVLWYFFTH